MQLIIPVGLEKREFCALYCFAEKVNLLGLAGFRFFPVPSQVFTELASLQRPTGAKAEINAGVSVCGAKGSYWLAITGIKEQEGVAEKLLVWVLFNKHLISECTLRLFLSLDS